MALTTNQILTYLQLPKLGRVTAFALAKYSLTNNISLETTKDIINFFDEYKNQNNLKRLAEYDSKDYNTAIMKAKQIIDNSSDSGIEVISYYDDAFPVNLKGIVSKGRDVSPLILYYKGDIEKTNNLPAIAIIGTRQPTPEGVRAGIHYGEIFAEKGYNIVSGLAIGCDASGHRGALNAKGYTTAILAHGLDTIYPKENKGLADEIVAMGGLLLSEYPIKTFPMSNFFVERDRLQAGLAQATIVVQTGIQGGTMHAVRATIENNKHLFVVQYKDESIMNNVKVLGNLKLIEEGAHPLRNNIDDIINLIKSGTMEKINAKEIVPEDVPKHDDKKDGWAGTLFQS